MAHPKCGGPFTGPTPGDLFANLSAGAKMVLPVDFAAAVYTQSRVLLDFSQETNGCVLKGRLHKLKIHFSK